MEEDVIPFIAISISGTVVFGSKPVTCCWKELLHLALSFIKLVFPVQSQFGGNTVDELTGCT